MGRWVRGVRFRIYGAVFRAWAVRCRIEALLLGHG